MRSVLSNMVHKEFHCVFALMTIQISSCLVYNVKPSSYNSSMNCTNPAFCFELNDIPMLSFEFSNAELQLLAGNHKLNKQITLYDARNFSIIGKQVNVTVICTPGSGQLFFRNSAVLNIANITFMNCGAMYANNIATKSPAVIVFYKCALVQIFFTKFYNSQGHGVIAVNMKGIFNASFFNNQSLSATRVPFFEKATLIIEHCTFQKSRLSIVTALTLIQSSKSSSEYLQVHILNSKFTDSRYNGPLMSFQYNSYAYMSLLLHNVTINKNQCEYGFSLIKLLDNSLSSHNSINSVTKSQVKFRHCLISSNKAANIIKHSTSLPLDLHLIMDNCIFSDNIAAISIILIENYLTVVSIKNSKYTDNTITCDDPELHKGCALLICHTDGVIFTGLNEFSFNLLICNFFWVLNDYITLEDNTLLNFTSNVLEGDILIRINRVHKIRFCPIQYVSKRGSLDKEFTSGTVLNFSLIFHNNNHTSKKKKIMPYLMKGKSLKDCEWLPNSAFMTQPPGIVAKRFVHFDHQNLNPIEYNYAGCLCYKDNDIDCLTDQIGPIYPGQTVEIGFAIIDPELDAEYDPGQKKQKFLQGLLKDNSTCQMELIGGTLQLGLKQTVPRKCSYFNYTITSYQQSLQECTFKYQFHTTYGLNRVYNKYYIFLLACPPGFLFENGKCTCHPNLKEITHSLVSICNIANQSVLRPGNVWITYYNATGEIAYALNCPIQYCSSFSFYIQLVNPNQQCVNNRKGLMCGECAEEFSAIFGSSRCKKCSNIWLTIILAITLAGLLLVIALFAFKIDVTNTNITGLILYANIISLNYFNIFSSNASKFPLFSATILISLLNLDLGFELCFYDGMTEYAKLWLQFIFPAYLILLTSLLLYVRKHAQCVKRFTRQDGNAIMGIMILMCSNKVIVACQNLFLYNRFSYLKSDESKYLWSIYPSIPLFDTYYLLYFLFTLVLVIALIIFNIMTFSQRLFKRNLFISTLNGYQFTTKEKHIYWPIVELLLRFIIASLSVLNKQLSVLLNTMVIIVFVCCLCIASPFKNTKNTFTECTFGFNLVCVFVCASYYGDTKTTTYYILVNVLIFLAVIEFLVQVMYYSSVQRFYKVCKHVNKIKYFQICQNRCKNCH